MEESLTFSLPDILKMLEDPYAAWRLLFLRTQVSSLYCYNSFSRTGFFFASTNDSSLEASPYTFLLKTSQEHFKYTFLLFSLCMRDLSSPNRG
ncbi:unnamed protein product [Rangifer tarandus platyrhynchus]|uniref:Uncharacterized protein n=1 Tax=Rangifer tarandus platyrhynchus TaxID=3082113 RepID=A0AC59Y821_RANTA